MNKSAIDTLVSFTGKLESMEEVSRKRKAETVLTPKSALDLSDQKQPGEKQAEIEKKDTEKEPRKKVVLKKKDTMKPTWGATKMAPAWGNKSSVFDSKSSVFGSKTSVFGSNASKSSSKTGLSSFASFKKSDSQSTFGDKSKKSNEPNVFKKESSGVFDKKETPASASVHLPENYKPKTGEEGETTLFATRSRCFLLDIEAEEWKERGIGPLKVLSETIEGVKHARVVMRQELVHNGPGTRVVMNMALVFGIRCEILSDRSVQLSGIDADNKAVSYLFRVRNSDLAKKFSDTVTHLIPKESKKPVSEPIIGETTEESVTKPTVEETKTTETTEQEKTEETVQNEKKIEKGIDKKTDDSEEEITNVIKDEKVEANNKNSNPPPREAEEKTADEHPKKHNSKNPSANNEE